MTPEQEQALALARARARMAEIQSQPEQSAFSQFLQAAKPEPFTEAVARGMFYDPAIAIGQIGSRVVGAGQEQMDRAAAENERRLQEIEYGGVGRFTGNVLSPATALLAKTPAVASRIPGLGGSSTAQNVAKSAITGGVAAPLMAPATSGNFAEEKAIQTGAGAVLGPVFDLAASPLARMATPSLRPELVELQRQGVDISKLSPGQQLGGGFKRFEESMRSTPVVGSMIREAEVRGFEEFNRGLIDSVIKQANPKATLPKAVSTGGAIDFAGKELSKAYNKALAPMKIQPSPNLFFDVSDVVSRYSGQLSDDNIKLLEKLVKNNVTDLIPQNKVLAGNTAKRIDSMLGTIERTNRKSTDAQQNAIGEALGEIKDLIRGEIASQDPTGKVSQLNRAYAEFVRLEKAASLSGRQGNTFTPEQLIAASRAMDESKRKASSARGQALMRRAGEAGRDVLGSQVPDSGTVERGLSQLVLGGLGTALATGSVPSGAVGPLVAAGGLGALYSPAGQIVLRKAVPAGPVIREIAPVVGPVRLESLLD